MGCVEAGAVSLLENRISTGLCQACLRLQEVLHQLCAPIDGQQPAVLRPEPIREEVEQLADLHRKLTDRDAVIAELAAHTIASLLPGLRIDALRCAEVPQCLQGTALRHRPALRDAIVFLIARKQLLQRITRTRRSALRAAGSSIQPLHFLREVRRAESFSDVCHSLIEEDTKRIRSDLTDHDQILARSDIMFHIFHPLSYCCAAVKSTLLQQARDGLFRGVRRAAIPASSAYSTEVCCTE